MHCLHQQAIAEEERDFATTEPALTFLQHVSEGMKTHSVNNFLMEYDL